MAGRYGLDCTPRARSASIVLSRSIPCGSWTTNTHQPREAPGGGVVEPVELGQAQGARDVAEPVVEAQAIVVEPVHVRRAALVALGVDALLVLRRAHGDHPA